MISVWEVVITVLLFVWVIFVAEVLTRRLYGFLTGLGLEHHVAVYYNRKIIHILTGGMVAFLVPFIFKTPIFPFAMAMLLAVFLYVPHRRGKIMYWFQTEENAYEVSFCIMWGVVISLGWLISSGESFWYGVLPVIFMSVGDAITGIVRNILYKRRTKSWWGNLAMASFSIPTGAFLGVAGMIAGATASLIEHFESNPIDDNITVPLSSFLILVLARVFAPWLLSF
ncbi:dolichol kinase [Candidatus Bathyarchaeota archaeon]|nr:dolichol kinase [Candidatus Bathyarchaeota archaeon]